MVIKTQIKTKEGEPYTTKDGEKIYEHYFDIGDTFIPQYSNVSERTHDAMVKGKKKTITEYSIKVNLKDSKGKEHNDIYIKLTPSQSRSIQKKIDSGIEINQNLWIAYEYLNDYGNQIGVGIKSNNKPAKTFEDFEGEE